MQATENVLKLIEKLSSLKKDMHDSLQSIDFDSILYTKFLLLQEKLVSKNYENYTNIYFGNDLKNANPSSVGCNFKYLKYDFFSDPNVDPEEGSIFIITNNDIGSSLHHYIKYREKNKNSLFIVWDWDNQHWTYMSCMLSLQSDFYISGGSENSYFISHFSPNILGPVFGGVYQWSRHFLIENLNLFFQERSNNPLGVHYFYPDYPQRNRAIASVNKSFPTVRFGDNSYKSKSDLENLIEWTSHKTHWIMPVLGGMPLRGYNAILTGGVPILPAYLKNFPEIQIMGNVPLFYEVADLIDPNAIQQAAIDKFDSAGAGGLQQRVFEAIYNQHIDSRCDRILSLLNNAIIKIKNNDRSYSDGYYTN